LQKLKESRNTRFCISSALNPGRGALSPANPQPTHRRIGSTKVVFGIKPRSIKPAVIVCQNNSINTKINTNMKGKEAIILFG
jgi:hypothetical protein